jgi:phosphotransferase system enzyme I (PtsI)
VIGDMIVVFQNIEDEYLRQRATDLEDIQTRVLQNLTQQEKDLAFHEDVILFAKDLTPSQTASLDLRFVKGFITEMGGKTSHSAILARALEIPAVMGVPRENLKNSKHVLLNAQDGSITIEPSTIDLEIFQKRSLDFINSKKEFLSLKGQKTKTRDGKYVELAANIGTAKDLPSVLENDAEAIGLYRTEFVFMDEKEMPSEEKQFQIYKEVFQKFPKKCIIRTLDIGGDKKLPYLHISEEMNPFLGLRAIRLCLKEKDLFKNQIKAILRAAHFHNDIWIMIPMISRLEEILETKKIFKECEEELAQNQTEFTKNYKFGVMIEVPSAALIIDEICEYVDFISIGTNDLIQYTCAVDRMNSSVENLYDPFHPGFLKLMAMIIKGAKAKNKFVGICGSIAHKKELVPYFVNWGVDELSMTAQHILPTRKLIASLDMSTIGSC